MRNKGDQRCFPSLYCRCVMWFPLLSTCAGYIEDYLHISRVPDAVNISRDISTGEDLFVTKAHVQTTRVAVLTDDFGDCSCLPRAQVDEQDLIKRTVRLMGG